MASAVQDDWTAVQHNPSSSSPAAAANQQGAGVQQKKPRHRHSPEQLAALNELFDKNEHPPLDARTALAERLGMETKTVNAWFQNKRASSKKRTRILASDHSSAPQSTTPPVTIPAPPAPPSAATTPGAPHPDLDEDDQPPHSAHERSSPHQKGTQPSEINASSNSSLFFANHADHHYFASSRDSPDPTGMARKMRMRPTPDQTEELKKLYNITPHPTSEERQALSERIQMRYQSITNWFQNQRSLAKRRREDDHTDTSSSNSKSDYPHHGDMRQYSAFPPRPPHAMHPSLVSDTALPPQSQAHLSPSEPTRPRRSPSVSPSMDDQYPRRSSMRRSTTPYSGPMQSRPRRSRPEPYQLDALKGLFTRTATPTIEERSALALEIGMDIGKVTNWFRNLRQTARKRNSRHHGAEQGGSGDDEDGDMQYQDDESPQYSSAVSRSASRAGTPSRSSSSSSSSGGLDGERDAEANARRQVPPTSTIPSDDEYPEAVTPENGRSPSPGPDVHRRMTHPMRDVPPPPPPPPPPHMPINRDMNIPPHGSYPHGQHYYAPPPPPPPFHPSYHHHPHMSMPGKPHHPHEPAVLGRFDAAIVDSSYPKHHPYMDEDPASCAETAKRFGIKLEDAYLLLDFHRQ